MQKKCHCGNNTFFAEVIVQYTGSDDTLQLVCTRCGDYYGYDIEGDKYE